MFPLQVQDLEFAQIEVKVLEGLKVGNDCLKKMHEVTRAHVKTCFCVVGVMGYKVLCMFLGMGSPCTLKENKICVLKKDLGLAESL